MAIIDENCACALSELNCNLTGNSSTLGRRSFRKERLTQIELLGRIERILPSEDPSRKLEKIMIAAKDKVAKSMGYDHLKEKVPTPTPNSDPGTFLLE